MRERPILFGAPMVRAILAGTKTQTRRIQHVRVDAEGVHPKVIARVGDTLWVRETWRADDFAPNDVSRTIYAADFDAAHIAEARRVVRWRPSIFMPRNRSRIALAVESVRVERLHAITTDDILAEGVRIPVGPEGRALLRLTGKAPPTSFLRPTTPEQRAAGGGWTDEELLHAEFASLWSEINGRESWDANPWVWVIGFRRVSR